MVANMQEGQCSSIERLLVNRIFGAYLAGKGDFGTQWIPSGYSADAFEVGHLSDSCQVRIREEDFLVIIGGLFTVAGCGGDSDETSERDPIPGWVPARLSARNLA